MDPVTISLILQFALKYGIPAARSIVELLQKPNPTLDDWNKAFDSAEDNAKKFLAENP